MGRSKLTQARLSALERATASTRTLAVLEQAYDDTHVRPLAEVVLTLGAFAIPALALSVLERDPAWDRVLAFSCIPGIAAAAIAAAVHRLRLGAVLARAATVVAIEADAAEIHGLRRGRAVSTRLPRVLCEHGGLAITVRDGIAEVTFAVAYVRHVIEGVAWTDELAATLAPWRPTVVVPRGSRP